MMKHDSRIISTEQQERYAEYERHSAKKYMAMYREWIGRYIAQGKMEIIDIGGGGGYFANEIANYYRQNGTDAAVYLVDNCKYDEWQGFDMICFIHDTAYAALNNFEDASIDICFLNLVLHHLVTDSYHKTKENQKALLQMIYRKLKPGGLVFIHECYYWNPILSNASMRMVHFMSTSKWPPMIKISKHFGSKSAGVGGCFLSNRKWTKILKEIGYVVKEYREDSRGWVRSFLIKEKFFQFLLQKES